MQSSPASASWTATALLMLRCERSEPRSTHQAIGRCTGGVASFEARLRRAPQDEEIGDGPSGMAATLRRPPWRTTSTISSGPARRTPKRPSPSSSTGAGTATRTSTTSRRASRTRSSTSASSPATASRSRSRRASRRSCSISARSGPGRSSCRSTPPTRRPRSNTSSATPSRACSCAIRRKPMR